MKEIRFSKKFWAIISALVVIGALFAYYLMVHVKGREADIVEKKYRILKRVGDNASKIQNDYKVSIGFFWNTYLNKIHLSTDSIENLQEELDKSKRQFYKLEYEVYRLEDDMYWSENDASSRKMKGKASSNSEKNTPTSFKTLEKNLKEKKDQQKTIEKKAGELTKKLKAIGKALDENLQSNLQSLDLRFMHKSYDEARHESLDTIYFEGGKSFDHHFKRSNRDDYDYEGFGNTPQDSCLGIPVSSFLKRSNLTSAQFDEFMLIRAITKNEKLADNQIVKHTSFYPESDENPYDEYLKQHYTIDIDCCKEKKTKPKDSDSTIYAIAYQTFNSKIELKHFDSLLVENHGLRSIPETDIKLAGMDYKLFAHRIRFAKDEEWILCGLVKSDTLKQTSREIDTWKLAFAFLIVIFVVLAMPILKLLVMSGIERLRIINVWSTGFSITLGTSFLVLILLSANQLVGYKSELDDKLNSLLTSIDSGFTTELKTIHDQLDSVKVAYKDRVSSGYKLQSAIFDSAKNNFHETKKFFPYHQSFNEVLWLNEKGDQHLTLSTYKQDTATVPLNLGKRKYFSKALNDSLWILPLVKDDTKNMAQGANRQKFALQSIRSWTSGHHEVGFSIKLDSAIYGSSVLAMATKLYSVMDPMLSPGYGFCIIDEKGDVWFHSETEKNTQENFLEETDQNEEIKASIEGRLAKKSLEVMYNDSKHRVLIQPINNIPLYLVTFYDLKYYKVPMIMTLYLTFLLIVLLFSFQGIQLFFLFICVYKPTKLKIKRFFLKWLRPCKNEVAPVSDKVFSKLPAEKYLRSILVQALFFVFIFVFLFGAPHSHAITFCIFILPIYLFTFQYCLLECEEIIRDRKKIFRHPFVWISTGLIVLINLAAYKYIDQYSIAFIIQVIFLGVFSTGYILDKWIKEWSSTDWVAKVHFGKLYFIMIFLWLSISAVLPVFRFYTIVSLEENLIWKKYLDLQTAKQDFKRSGNLALDYKLFKQNSESLQAKGNYVKSTNELYTEVDTSQFETQVHSSLYDLEFAAVPPFSRVIKDARAMLAEAAADGKWRWYNHKEKTHVRLNFTNDDGQTRDYAGPTRVYSFWRSDYVLLFLVLFVAFGFLILYSTIFAVRSIFGLGLVTDHRFIEYAHQEVTSDLIIKLLSPPNKKEKDDTDTVTQNINRSIQINSIQPERIFIVGLPYSGKSELIAAVKQKISDQNISVEEFDFRSDLENRILSMGQKVFVVTHFEHGLNDHSVNQKKLEATQRLFKSGAHIIVCSTVQPSAILEFYADAIRKINPQKNDELKKECTEYKQAIRIWKNLLSGFIVLYQPLSENLPNSLTSDFAKSELLHGHYLLKTHLLLENEACETYEEKENYVLRVEELAETYYQSLWNSFSNSDKHLLYDLAKDRFVNLRNLTGIRVLMQKGVIIADDTLSIMNKSFSNFILSAVNEDEEVRMEKELHQKGAWSMVRSVLIIVLIGLATFIALAQQNLLQDFNVLLGAIGSVTALLTRFGGLFGTSKKEG